MRRVVGVVGREVCSVTPLEGGEERCITAVDRVPGEGGVGSTTVTWMLGDAPRTALLGQTSWTIRLPIW